MRGWYVFLAGVLMLVVVIAAFSWVRGGDSAHGRFVMRSDRLDHAIVMDSHTGNVWYIFGADGDKYRKVVHFDLTKLRDERPISTHTGQLKTE